MHLSDCFVELFTYIRLLTGKPEMAGADYDAVRRDIDTIIERMNERHDQSAVADEYFDDARFAVFAWADEAVLVSSWSGVRDWLRLPLQRQYYDTANAGEEFFEHLDKLLHAGSGPVDDSIFTDLGSEVQGDIVGAKQQNGIAEVLEVYALCLSLGFTGKYFSESDADRLEKLRRDCLDRIPGSAGDKRAPAFPQSYATGKPGSRKCCYGRVFDPVSIVFFILPVLVVAGMFLAYRGLLERSLELWFG